MNTLSTRDKILKISHKLFADKGVNGVSVREIAKECDVNISAVNYHFTNKENLYLETIRCSVVQTATEIKEIYDSLEVKSLESIVMKVYEHFMKNSQDLRTAFKLIISSEKFAEAMGHEIKTFNGPPGGEYFAYCLKDEFPTISEEDANWGVRILFTHVMHKALMMCNKSICESLENTGVSQEVLVDDIRRLVRIVKSEIKHTTKQTTETSK